MSDKIKQSMKKIYRSAGFRRALALLLVCQMVVSSGNIPGVLANQNEGGTVSGNSASEKQKITEDTPATTNVDLTDNTDGTDTEALKQDTPATTAEGDVDTEIINVSSYSQNLLIYNYMTCSAAATDGSTITYFGKITGTANQYSVIVGNQNSYPEGVQSMDHDITVDAENVRLSDDSVLQVNPVGSGSNKVDMTTSGITSFAKLVISENAKLSITLESDLTVTELNMAAGAELVINTNGHKISIEDFHGSETCTVTITGSGSAEFTSAVTAGTVNITDAAVTAASIHAQGALNLTDAKISTTDGNGAITANGNIVMSGGSISGAGLFGYGADASGLKSMSIEGASFSNVAEVGAAKGANAVVVVSGTPTGSTNTRYYVDYQIQYFDGETEITEITGPKYYRVCYETAYGTDGTIVGSHSDDSYTESSEVDLPEYTEPGYIYIGWKKVAADEAETAVQSLTEAAGNVVLYVHMTPGKVSVSYDLDYEPDETTNDETVQKTWTEAKDFGEVLNLQTPVRFGYSFEGWKITSSEAAGLVAGNHEITVADVKEAENADYQYEMSLVAQWKAETFPIRLALGNEVPIEHVEISLDGGTTYTAVSNLSTNAAAYQSQDNTVTFAKEISYGQTLEEYFTSLGISYPLLRDSRTDMSQKLRMINWKTDKGEIVTTTNQYLIGDALVGNKSADETLVSFQTSLKATPVTLVPEWGSSKFTLTIEADKLGSWSVLVNGTVKTPTDGIISDISAGDKITWRSSAGEKVNISNWSMLAYEAGVKKETLHAAERAYKDGDAYIYYDFTMPAYDVTASYADDGEAWIDLAKSPIIFAENVSYNNRALSGFWYGETVDELSYWFYDESKGYFYVWDFSKPFYVTTSKSIYRLKIITYYK